MVLISSWEREISNCISTVDKLKKHLDISKEEEKDIQKIIKKHPMCISRYYLSLIDKDDPKDPIKRMVVPSKEELDECGSYDTSGERENTKLRALQHKYSQTALILSTNRCASYCRYCFRKRLVGLDTDEILDRFSDAAEYIKNHKEINNVLISGGDPLILSTDVINEFIKEINKINHVKFIRFGSKIPVTFPDRILDDDKLIEVLGKNSKINRRIYVVSQFNHPKEITEKASKAIDRLIKAGVLLNNQTVLLKGVNDDPKVLAQLQNKLISCGVAPYYVFQCRPVKRVIKKFQLPLYDGYKIVEDTKKLLNGHSKHFKYIMSHYIGKIEIVGMDDNYFYFKQHQAKNKDDIGKFFKKRISKTAGWLDELDN